MATIKEIAKLANVSISTISRVLNQDETLNVSQEVRTEIFKIAHELKYIPPKMRHARKSDQVVIGVADWHIVRRDRQNVSLEKLDLVVKGMLGKKEIQFVRLLYLEEQPVDGIIAFGNFSEEEMQFLRMQSYSMVFVNSDQRNYEYDSIVMDYEQGLKDMVTYLLERKEYRSIGYVGGIYQENGIQIGAHRLQALKKILESKECFQESFFAVGEISRESGYQLTEQLLNQASLPEVLILGSDEIAEGALSAIKEAKLRIPRDLAVILYKDIDTLESKYPTYTSLRMLPDCVWSTAIKLLLEQIFEKRKDSMKVYLPTKLHIGDSA